MDSTERDVSNTIKNKCRSPARQNHPENNSRQNSRSQTGCGRNCIIHGSYRFIYNIIGGERHGGTVVARPDEKSDINVQKDPSEIISRRRRPLPTGLNIQFDVEPKRLRSLGLIILFCSYCCCCCRCCCCCCFVCCCVFDFVCWDLS